MNVCGRIVAGIHVPINALTWAATDSLSPDGSVAQPTELPKSIEATQIPALRHPPSARRVGSVHTVSQTVAPNGHSGY